MTQPTLRQRASGEVATTADDEPTMGQLVERLRPQMARVLQDGGLITPDRLARIALSEMKHTPRLAECSSASFLGALMTCAQLQLEPGSATGECWLIPRKIMGRWECQFQMGYQGYAKLFWQHPLAKHLAAEVVYEGDEFDYAYGSDPFLRHKPALGAAADRKVVAYYAVASLTRGGQAMVVLTPAEVAALRGGNVGPGGNVKDPMRWMERKVAVAQLLKLMPKSPQLVQALAQDETIRVSTAVEAIDEPGHRPALEGSATPTDPTKPHAFLWGDLGAESCAVDGCELDEAAPIHEVTT